MSSPSPQATGPRFHHVPDYRWPDSFGGVGHRVSHALLCGLYFLARRFGRAVRFVRRSNAQALLVIRTDGLGDAVLFEPALRSLAERFPKHQIHLWAPQPVCELYRAAPYISKLKPIPRGCKAGNLAFFRSPVLRAYTGYLLGRWAFDIAIYPAESAEPLGNFLVRVIDANQRWIVDADTENQFPWQKALAEAGASRILSTRFDGGHELDRNAHLANQWGADVAGRRPEIHFADDAAQIGGGRVRTWRSIAARVDASALVGIVPSAMNIAKSYPVASWARVIHELWEDHRVMPAFLNTPDELAVVHTIMSQIPDVPFVDMTAPVEVLALASIMTRLDGIISIDTGSAHLALAADLPSVILCGGGHPGRFIPWSNIPARSIVLTHDVDCAGCHGRCTQSEKRCLTDIHPTRVAAAARQMLGMIPMRLRAAG